MLLAPYHAAHLLHPLNLAQNLFSVDDADSEPLMQVMDSLSWSPEKQSACLNHWQDMVSKSGSWTVGGPAKLAWKMASVADVDTRKWYRLHGQRSSAVRDLAMEVFLLRASQTPAERHWGSFDYIYFPKRSSLDPSKADRLCSMYWNFRQMRMSMVDDQESSEDEEPSQTVDGGALETPAAKLEINTVFTEDTMKINTCCVCEHRFLLMGFSLPG